MSESKTFPITTGFFAMPLGLGALGIAWLNATSLFPYAEQIGNLISGCSVLLWCILLGCYFYRIIFYLEQIKAEFTHPCIVYNF